MTKKEIGTILKPYNEDIKRHINLLKDDFENSDWWKEISSTFTVPSKYYTPHLEAHKR